MITAIVGTNWGDEGKGRMVDLLSEEYDIICRYQGGNNAGHTVINERGKFILNLLPSGILRETTINVMGNGMVVDIEHLAKEIGKLKENGINITPDNLKISDKATICMPYHVLQDCIEEDRLKDKKFGSTRRGIAPVYADKYMKKTLRFSDLFDKATLKQKIIDIIEWKNILFSGYDTEELIAEQVYDRLLTHAEPLIPYITNVTTFLTQSVKAGKSVMFEAQLGALRDIDFGIYPYTSSSSTIAAYAPIGAGIPGVKLEKTIGIMKAYSSCVGEGPFTAELFGEEGDKLRGIGDEFGAATGRPRRVGGFDVVASKYGADMQGATELALTKLDILSYLDKIPVCVAYEVDGEIINDFPTGDKLLRAKPVYEYLDGFNKDITGCRTVQDLPKQAQDYVKYIEAKMQCPITYISVGPERDSYITV